MTTTQPWHSYNSVFGSLDALLADAMAVAAPDANAWSAEIKQSSQGWQSQNIKQRISQFVAQHAAPSSRRSTN